MGMATCSGEPTCLPNQACGGCFCAHQGDLAPGPPGDPSCGDGIIDVLDVVALVNRAFRNGDPLTRDATCVADRGDWNCDGINDVLDVVAVVNNAFRNSQIPPCDPCTCMEYPTDCPPWPPQ
jgi:hypothetical protein